MKQDVRNRLANLLHECSTLRLELQNERAESTDKAKIRNVAMRIGKAEDQLALALARSAMRKSRS